MFYDYQISVGIQELFDKIDKLKSVIDKSRKVNPYAWVAIQEKLRFDWTYNSNAIEGNTLTMGDTIFFLREGLTVNGKPLNDYLYARNHADTIDFLYDAIKNKRPMNERLIQEINGLLLLGVKHTISINQFGDRIQKIAHPGQYKIAPNHVITPHGEIHYYVDPLQVPVEMQTLCNWANQKTFSHPVLISSIAHYNMVRIHPFDDGNGRGARMLMNLILIKNGYPPAIIRNENRQDYIEALSIADKGDVKPFIMVVAQSLIETQQQIVENLKKGIPQEPGNAQISSK
jgi:Fic family protein